MGEDEALPPRLRGSLFLLFFDAAVAADAAAASATSATTKNSVAITATKSSAALICRRCRVAVDVEDATITGKSQKRAKKEERK